MSKNEVLAIVIFITGVIASTYGVLAIEKYRKNKYYTLELIARAPENGNWYPKTFTIPYNKDVRILIRNIDTVTHGFAIPDFNITAGEIKAGEVKVVKFNADKKGTFPFMCTIWCSERHMDMRGKITVE